MSPEEALTGETLGQIFKFFIACRSLILIFLNKKLYSYIYTRHDSQNLFIYIYIYIFLAGKYIRVQSNNVRHHTRRKNAQACTRKQTKPNGQI